MIYYVIPAREGSKGLPGKNRLLFEYTANIIPKDLAENVIVTTDDNEIIKKALDYGFIVIERSKKLSSDTASMKDVLIDVRSEMGLKDEDIIVMLYLTYPERTWKDVCNALKFYDYHRGLSLLCKKRIKTNPFLCLYENGFRGKQVIKHNLHRRQDYHPIFELSHFIFISDAWNLDNLNLNLYNEDTIFFQIKDCVDVDNFADLKEVI